MEKWTKDLDDGVKDALISGLVALVLVGLPAVSSLFYMNFLMN